MINLVKDHVYDLPSEFKMVNKDIDRFYKNLIDMRKPFINKIVEEINKKKIKVMYTNEVQDPRVLVLSKSEDSVMVNISDIAKRLSNNIASGNISFPSLYSYLLQAYGILKWNSVSQSRDVIRALLDVYYTIMVPALTPKGIGVFKNDQDKNKLKFLLYCFVLGKSKTIVRDHVEFAARTAGVADDEYVIEVFDRHKELLEKPGSFEQFYQYVLCEEYKWMNELEDTKYIILSVYRKFGPTAAQMIDDLRYGVPILLDFVQSATPIVYKNYDQLKTIKATAYKIVFDSLSGNMY